MKFLDLYGDLSKYTFENDLDISNQGLTSLEGMPHTIVGTLNCSGNKLITLKGMPLTIDGHCLINDNKLTSLKGIAKAVNGNIHCDMNKLTSLEGIPEKLYGIIYCLDNPNKYLQKEFYFRLNNPQLPEHMIKIKMYLKTKSEYYLTQKEYDNYLEKFPEYLI